MLSRCHCTCIQVDLAYDEQVDPFHVDQLPQYLIQVNPVTVDQVPQYLIQVNPGPVDQVPLYLYPG